MRKDQKEEFQELLPRELVRKKNFVFLCESLPSESLLPPFFSCWLLLPSLFVSLEGEEEGRDLLLPVLFTQDHILIVDSVGTKSHQQSSSSSRKTSLSGWCGLPLTSTTRSFKLQTTNYKQTNKQMKNRSTQTTFLQHHNIYYILDTIFVSFNYHNDTLD